MVKRYYIPRICFQFCGRVLDTNSGLVSLPKASKMLLCYESLEDMRSEFGHAMLYDIIEVNEPAFELAAGEAAGEKKKKKKKKKKFPFDLN